MIIIKYFQVITLLLQQSPLDRLGTGGAAEVKEHLYFAGIDWANLLRMKADFIPQLESEEDTSYFDTRADRYDHATDPGDTDPETRSSAEDSLEDAPLFRSFSSCSPRYRRVREVYRHSVSRCESLDTGDLPSLATSLVSSPTAAAEVVTTKPELRRQSEVATESTRADRATNAMSCPDLETMVASSGLKLPAVVGPPRPGSPRTSSRTRRHRSDRQLPKFSISLEEAEAWAVQAGLSSGPASLPAPALTPAPASKHFPEIPSPLVRSEQRPSMVRSTSATGLSLMIPPPPSSRTSVSSVASTNKNLIQSLQSPGTGGSSTASSRDASPCREVSPLINTLKPPIIIRRGPRGFGFTLRAIRVYFGDTDLYTVHHLVMEVEKGSPAHEARLRAGDLVTHINGEGVAGLVHTQVLQLLVSGGEAVTMRATPLETTSIKTGGRRRDPSNIKMARRTVTSSRLRQHKKREADKRRKTSSLFRKLSNKRASAEMAGMLSASSSLQSLKDPLSESGVSAGECSGSGDNSSSSVSSTSPSSSTRPSTLGLKHKLHLKTKTASSRRKSSGAHIPLSPLARTPSPTRTPSPLALPLASHQQGASKATQTFSVNLSSSNKKSLVFHRRQKSLDSASPGCGSPLLRRALSPDRLHPRTAETPGAAPGRGKAPAISPLCTSSSVSTSPLPSRATHSSPGSSQESGRKHSTKSLNQSTIPEEGPDQEDQSQNKADKDSGKETKVFKSLSLTSKRDTNNESKKLTSSRSKTKEETLGPNITPKLVRTGSMTEKTVQKISKIVRKTSRSESRPKQNREASNSPIDGNMKTRKSADLHIQRNKSSLSESEKNTHDNKKKSEKPRAIMKKNN